jgi:hypothetical protein
MVIEFVNEKERDAALVKIKDNSNWNGTFMELLSPTLSYPALIHFDNVSDLSLFPKKESTLEEKKTKEKKTKERSKFNCHYR